MKTENRIVFFLMNRLVKKQEAGETIWLSFFPAGPVFEVSGEIAR